MLLLVAAMLVLPFVEIAVMVWVADAIGFLNMVGLLLVVSVAGVFVVKFQGTGAWRKIQAELQMGHVPGTALVDGGLILLAGVLLVIPGFVTDVVGLLLLLPTARHLLRGWLNRRFRIRVAVASDGTSGSRRRGGDVIDVQGSDKHREHPELDPPR